MGMDDRPSLKESGVNDLFSGLSPDGRKRAMDGIRETLRGPESPENKKARLDLLHKLHLPSGLEI